MNSLSVTRPIEKSVVLFGAGNAHLVFLKRLRMRPMPGVSFTLVNEAATVPYSAMVPAYIGGEYPLEEITIDLVRLCQSAGVRFTAERATGVDPAGRRVLFADRPPLVYDVLSLGLGSLPTLPDTASFDDSIVMRPLDNLLRQIDALEARLTKHPGPFHLIVVGGGASGCELALAVHKRLSRHTGFRLTLLQGHTRLLPEFPPAAGRVFETAFRDRGIDFRVNAPVKGTGDGFVSLEGGKRDECDSVLWATQASAPPLLRADGLAVDAAGFLRVHDTLQSLDDPAVFAAGDCIAFETRPGLPKNGVYAVRQGAVLFDNVAAFLRNKPLRPFRPQPFYLTLLNTADGQAVLRYGPLVLAGRWVRRLKDHIDRAWMRKMTPPLPAASASERLSRNARLRSRLVQEEPLMRCGGCGSKISADVLSAVLKRLGLPDDPRVLLGVKSGEDAAVHRVRAELFGSDPEHLLEVQTVDSFWAFVDDPSLYGRIAALNAVSDLFAMNARPFSALAIATIPNARGPIQEAQLFELLSGAVHTFQKIGVVLTGGHTTEGTDLALGFAVTGFAEEGQLFQKNQLRSGDQLILTKPLGSGAILAAWMRGECRAAWFTSLVASMLLSNGPASEVFRKAGVTACTDVTGFGLAGHLLEMLDASGVSARINVKAVPLYQGFEEVVSSGVVSSLHAGNARTACRIDGTSTPPAWLFDPQTSGGLLGAVPAESAGKALAELHAAGCPKAAVIGDVVPTAPAASPVIHLL